jgi:PAS domain S-box-containing protein
MALQPGARLPPPRPGDAVEPFFPKSGVQLASGPVEEETLGQLREENAALRARLAHAEAELRSIRSENAAASADADSVKLVVDAADRERLFRQTANAMEQRLRFVLETIHAGAWELDLDSHNAFRSVEHDRIFGYPDLLPEWSYEAFLAHVVPEDRAEVDAQFQRAVETQGDWSFECRIRRADGQVRWIWAAGRHRGNSGTGGRRLSGIVQDITERKAAEAALHDAEDLASRRLAELEDLYRNAPVGLCVLDPELRYLRVNERLAEMNGIPAADHVGRTVRDLLPQIAEAVESGLRHVLATGEPKHDIEIAGETPARPGLLRSWTEQWLPIKDTDGLVAGLSIVVEEITERKAANDALRVALGKAEAGDRMLAALMDNVPEGITICDASGTLRMVSRYGQELLGKPHTGNSLEEVAKEWSVFREDGETAMPLEEFPLVRALGGEIVQDAELLQVNADGRKLPLLCNAAPIRDTAGQIIAAVATWRDISERRETERALRESEERLRLLGDNLPDSAVYQYLHEPDGRVRFVYFSAGVERMNGVPAADVLRDAGALHRQIPAEHMGRLAEAEARSKRERSDFDVEVPMCRPDGETRWVRLHSRPRSLPGGQTVWDGVQIDITQRRAAEAALRESELRYRTLVDATSAVSWSCPPSGLQIAPQPAWMAFTGQSAEEMLGTGWTLAVHPDDAAAAGEKWRAAVERCQSFTNEHRIRRRDGQWRWMSIHAAPIQDAEDQIVEWIGMCLDITDRRTTEEALRQSERRFRQVTESLPQLVWTCAADGPCDYLSPQWVQYTGKSEAEQLGYRWLEQLHPDDRQRTVDLWQATAAKGATFDIEFRIRRHDGAYRWFRTLAVPLRDEAGGIAKWFGSNTDIEEIKQAEAALRESEERFRLFMDNSPTIAWVKDDEGRVVYLSRAYEQRVGMTLAHARGKTEAELWPPDTTTEFRKNDLAVLAGDRPVQVTEETRGPDGSRCHWLVTKFPFRDAAGRRFVAGIGLDITVVKQAEAALKESEARYRAIGESLAYGVWACDAQGKNTYASESFLKLVGLTQKECAEFGWGDVLHPDDAERTIATWKECSRTGGKWDIQHRFRGVDGLYHDILARGVPIRNDGGEITSWVGINLDISRLKEAERALEEARAQLQVYAQELEDRVAQRTARLAETVADLEHFSYAITHDMRAPLRAMQGFSNLLEEEFGEGLSAEGRDYLRRIHSAADRLDRLITDSLNYGKTVAEQPEFEAVDLGRLIPDLVDTYPNFQPSQADISIMGRLPVVRGSTAYLTQCFANLLANAVKFARPDTRPRVRVWAQPSPLRSDWSRIWVEDQGIGIPCESLERIFGLFQRATADREGTGIGLAIVRKVVERMGGQVGVESTEGEGSRFWVDLQQISGEAPGPARPPEKA